MRLVVDLFRVRNVPNKVSLISPRVLGFTDTLGVVFYTQVVSYAKFSRPFREVLLLSPRVLGNAYRVVSYDSFIPLFGPDFLII